MLSFVLAADHQKAPTDTISLRLSFIGNHESAREYKPEKQFNVLKYWRTVLCRKFQRILDILMLGELFPNTMKRVAKLLFLNVSLSCK